MKYSQRQRWNTVKEKRWYTIKDEDEILSKKTIKLHPYLSSSDLNPAVLNLSSSTCSKISSSSWNIFNNFSKALLLTTWESCYKIQSIHFVQIPCFPLPAAERSPPGPFHPLLSSFLRSQRKATHFPLALFCQYNKKKRSEGCCLRRGGKYYWSNNVARKYRIDQQSRSIQIHVVIEIVMIQLLLTCWKTSIASRIFPGKE